MGNKKQVSLAMQAFLKSKEYSPLAKFFVLLKLDAYYRANDEEAKRLIKERIDYGIRQRKE